MQVRGVISGRYIELLSETDLPNGLPVTVDIRPELLSLAEKRELIDRLCGSWANDDSLRPIFSEIERERRDSVPREVNFDVAP